MQETTSKTPAVGPGGTVVGESEQPGWQQSWRKIDKPESNLEVDS